MIPQPHSTYDIEARFCSNYQVFLQGLVNLEPYVLSARWLVVIPLWITVKEKLDQIESLCWRTKWMGRIPIVKKTSGKIQSYLDINNLNKIIIGERQIFQPVKGLLKLKHLMWHQASGNYHPSTDSLLLTTFITPERAAITARSCLLVYCQHFSADWWSPAPCR